MSVLGMIEFLRRHIKTLTKVLIAYLAALILFDLLLPRNPEHAHYYVDKVRAFWMLFGVIGCFVLIKVAKFIAHLLLSKDEDYYG